METEHSYEVLLNWLVDRKGILSSPVLYTELEVATPPQFPKGMEGIWSPEHLFVASVNSCIMTTFLSIAENSKLLFESYSSKAIGKLEIVEGKYMLSEIRIMATVTLNEQGSEGKAERLLKKLEGNCLISNSIKSKIIFESQILIKL